MKDIGSASQIRLSGQLRADGFTAFVERSFLSTAMKRARCQFIAEVGRLLIVYRFWGLAAVVSFAALISLMLAAWQNKAASYPLLVANLLAGFLWIGSTSISRHSLIRLKYAIGARVGFLEFLSTQFVFILFPYSYKKVKKEIERFAEKY